VFGRGIVRTSRGFRLLGVSVVLAFAAVWSSEFFLRRKKTT
jgi:hypothetical protein